MIELVLRTVAGHWAPLVWLAGFAIALAIALLIRKLGRKKFREGTEQTLAFFSGNLAPEQNIASRNLYWGFFDQMRGYFELLKRIHTGIVNDYVFCFVLLLIVLLAAAAIGGLLWV